MYVPFNDLKLHHNSLQPALNEALQAVIRESTFIRGPAVEAFERDFAAALGGKHCISCANGTDALYIVMRALGLNSGEEVITTAHSWISTSETITQAGGHVVFCDTDADTFTIDPEQIAAKITPRTRGIIPVHLYGQAANMDPILELARSHNLWVIEDCAQAHLATYHGRVVGTMGAAATFSFYPGKNLGAIGDAGGILTDRDDLAEWMTAFARHGGKGEHVMEGINSRMDGIQGAVLRLKLPHLAGWSARRREIAKSYNQFLAGVGDLKLPVVGVGREHVYHLYVIKTAQREGLRKYLKEHDVETGVNYPKALPFYPAYNYLKHKPEDFPNAFRNQSQILSLPIFPEMNEAQILHVASSIKSYFSKQSAGC
jgi:dTDP-4-amino-4,6-dideoxygalactose transaminase